jgi:hypothetical protein
MNPDVPHKNTGDTLSAVELNSIVASCVSKQDILPFAINNSDVELSKSDLNTAYPDAVQGQIVLLANAFVKYIKLDNSDTGDWETQPYNVVS